MKNFNTSYLEVLDLFEDYYKEKVEVIEEKMLSGGSINKVSVLSLSNDEKVLLKKQDISLFLCCPNFFESEMRGLILLNQVSQESEAGFEIPKLIGHRKNFLMMNYFEQVNVFINNQTWFELGKKLAQFHHRGNQKKIYGLDHDNYIGRAEQKNEWRSSWRDFFKVNRLEIQLYHARKNGFVLFSDRRTEEDCINRMLSFLPDHPQASLLHGDFWAGNFFFAKINQENESNNKNDSVFPVLIDPAVYYGHYEVDLAMTELFGGFPKSFYNGYRDVTPEESGYEIRKQIYNLYHLLNHLNLFGSSYLDSVKLVIDRWS